MEWTHDNIGLLREFWYSRQEWYYHRTRSPVASARYEKAMTAAAYQIVDLGLRMEIGGSMPTVEAVEKRLSQ